MAGFEEPTWVHRFATKPIPFSLHTVTDTIPCSITRCSLARVAFTGPIIDSLHWRRLAILVIFGEVEGQFCRAILRLAALLKPFGCDTEQSGKQHIRAANQDRPNKEK